MKRLLFVCLAAVGAVVIGHAQTPLDPAKLLNPGTDSWPSYNGDYSGRRFSTLTTINDKNIGALSLAWVYRVNLSDKGGTTIKGTPVVIDGVMYLTVPDHVWAIDARTGRQLWHHAWTSKGGIHIGNRGVAVLGDALFYETPDCTLVSLNIKDGSERWHKQICDLEQFYYGSVAPIPVKNHIIAGVSGDDLDVPGYVQAHDPVTGEMQWRWYAVPQKQGDPGSETWPNEEAGRHGGGMTWQPVTYDPELNLLYVTTGNPQPVIAFRNREGANLFTASIVALNPDTGKMVWYFQSSPNDTHDWDATQTAVLIDDVVDGRPRKLLAQASRNGMYFLLDRTNGKAIVSSDYAKTNWSKGYDAKGQPDPRPGEEAAGGRRSRDARSGRRDELALTELQPGDRPLLRRRVARVQHLLYLRSGREPAGVGRHGSRRLVGVDAAGDRLQDGQDPLVASLGHQHALGPPHDGRQPALRGRQQSGSRRVERHDRRRHLARASRQQRLERTHHVRNGRSPVRHRRRGRHAVCVRDEQRKVRRWRE